MTTSSSQPTARPNLVGTLIDEDRLWQRHEDLGAIGGTAKGGVNRQALTGEEVEARALIASWAEGLGFSLAVDPIGNMFIRREGTDPDAAPVVAGSHIDTQPTGGKYDGAYGVLAAFEVLEALERNGVKTRRPLEVGIWMNEEGSRFQPGCVGSGVFTGKKDLEPMLDMQDRAGISVREALKPVLGATPTATQRPLNTPIHAYLEAHIEQGPRLETEGLQIGVVTSIQGMRRFEIDIVGEEAHAGTTPRATRKDALSAAVRIITALEELMHDPDDVVRFTVGRMEVSPGSPNVVPGHVHFSIDFRHPDMAVLKERGDAVERIAQEKGAPCPVTVKGFGTNPPVHFPPEIVDIVRRGAERLDLPSMDMPSGAGHDAGLISAVAPVGMVFVPCERGISHNELERASAADLAAGTRVLAEAMVELANR
ncbi:MAG: M20 family metallo-hydrolase [Alphaproteobacteria bacterium]|nr:M20 family metallo-hydrolase [Alphaproteobacteria bacterium]MBU0797964.1 M20 family metallo-hydrolase [Alphaproteobacteria bacterium]MBU0885620.1 M20 family metallo-hydrolase [Alphaproteobacteria bacterium]MBU1812724.1 M20 family metallo-hydrolase [Alphaproteobacteria bacterium]